ncbi:MAG: DUF3343 domain-containing protein [Firmicutes bacterium]|jgi:hypothetical protein|nr:DUF3343 domain-containing protein [Bacillota bacterium]
MENYCYLTFSTTYFALRSEALLRETTLPFKLVPVPRSISSSCGTALRCSCTDLATIRETLERSRVIIEGSYGPFDR